MLGQVQEGWTGPAALTAAGLLASVLAWLFAKHLPAKDAQIKELLVMAADERGKDRDARHDMANTIQRVIAEMVDTQKKEIATIEDRHRDECERDRVAFMARSMRVEDAIRLQTTELKLAIEKSCRYDGAVDLKREP